MRTPAQAAASKLGLKPTPRVSPASGVISKAATPNHAAAGKPVVNSTPGVMPAASKKTQRLSELSNKTASDLMVSLQLGAKPGQQSTGKGELALDESFSAQQNKQQQLQGVQDSEEDAEDEERSSTSNEFDWDRQITASAAPSPAGAEVASASTGQKHAGKKPYRVCLLKLLEIVSD